MTDPVVPTPAAAPVVATGAVDPGKTLGIVGLILSFVGPASLLGFILCIVARNMSKKAGFKNTPATVGIVIGIIVLVISVIFIIIAAVTGGVSGSVSVN